jgi:nitrite reductase (NO-forming)
VSQPTTRPTGRGRSKLRDYPLVGWLLAAIVIALVHRWLPDANWLMLHLVLLGALTHSILVWSFHFAQTLLRAPASPRDARLHNVRLGLLSTGALAVVVGVPTGIWPLTLAGGTVVATAVAWHGLVLFRMLRHALPARFTVSVRYYLWAAASLVVGAGFGVTVAWEWPDPWHGRLLVAHALTNVLGWVGLTLTGTLLTLWPTMLRTQLDPTAERWTRQALPVLGGAIAVAVGGALAGLGWLAAVGVLGYLAGLALWGRGLWRPVRTRPPREFGPASVAAGLVWLVIGLGWAGWLLATAPDWQVVREGFIWPAAALGAGFGVQILTGALSYLLPSVLGGGPSVVRAGQVWFNKAGAFRLIAINGGLVLWLLPTPSWVKVAGSLLALAAGASFLPLMLLGLRASVAERRKLAAGSAEGAPEQPRPPVERPSIFTAGQLIAGLTALATVVVIGVGVDPAAAGVAPGNAATTAAVMPTGRVVRVEVKAIGMRFVPAQVHVNRGDQLVVDLVNDDTTTHDLVIGSATSGRIGPGARAVVDAGVIGASIQGYCSVVGHRQMGMVFDVIVDDAPAPGPSASVSPGHGMSSMPGHEMSSMPSASPTAPPADIVDPVLPPLTAEREHHVTLTVTEVPLEVAPGVWQRRWTYNGSPVGPTLHGRVGDTFVVTLVNDGTMGHSIDFHAGALAPDRPMRTIEPGESLTYTFTATRAGIWMYHCSTMPMTAHIAAGMTGAVVIEPDGLPKVDRSYVLVQSEVYLQTRAADAASATEVNGDAAASAGVPDYVVFNGVANGYDTAKLTARVGERVRFWVLDAGPNRAASFHVVGAQFDTVFSEGAYLLKHGRDAFGDRDGGSQALGLQVAQGGFVETVFPEAGRYPFVSHVMADAERGAHGFVQVTP